jgi:ComF family protein
MTQPQPPGVTALPPPSASGGFQVGGLKNQHFDDDMIPGNFSTSSILFPLVIFNYRNHNMRIVRRILDIFFPTSCSYCNSSIGDSEIPYFCPACWSDFTLMIGPTCPHCGRFFDSPETLAYSPDHRCRACRQEPPLFDQALSVGYFEGPLREAIHQFKYRPCSALGRPLGRWMAGNVRPVIDIDLVIPIPLHATRLRQRGFNQALLLAHELTTMFSLTLCFDNLVRIRSTRPQVELSGDERLRNVKEAFALKRPGDLNGKSVLLVDDVFTTGATMQECAKVLKKAGAGHVTALTLARAV